MNPRYSARTPAMVSSFTTAPSHALARQCAPDTLSESHAPEAQARIPGVQRDPQIRHHLGHRLLIDLRSDEHLLEEDGQLVHGGPDHPAPFGLLKGVFHTPFGGSLAAWAQRDGGVFGGPLGHPAKD